MNRSLPIILLLLLVACNFDDLVFDHIQAPTLHSRVALPIGELTYTLRELLDDVGDQLVAIEEDSSSLITLTYRDTVFFDAGQEVVDIKDISNSAKISVPDFPGSPVSRQETIDTVFLFEYRAENEEEVDSLFYNGGFMQVEIASSLPMDITYEVEILNTLRVSDDTPMSFSGVVETNASDLQKETLSGYKTRLLYENNQNIFQVNAHITMPLEAGQSIAAGDHITLTVSYLDQTFQSIFGKFGRDTVNIGKKVIDIKLFEDLGETGLSFYDPEIAFTFSNSFGIPVGVLFEDIYAVDSTSSGPDTTYLTGSATTTAQVIGGATAPGDSQISTVSLNKQNSNLADLLASSPSTLGLSITGISNPETLEVANFLLDSSRITAYMEVSMPLEVALNNVEETISFDLNENLQFDEADTASIRVVSENELPVSVAIKMDIRDEKDSVLYEIPQTLVIQAPLIGSDGDVIQSRQLIADIPLSREGIEAFQTGDQLILTLILNSPSDVSNTIYVKILADYMFNIKLAVSGRLNLEL